MKYPNIASSLGWTETPNFTGCLILEMDEVAKIEKDLGTGGLQVPQILLPLKLQIVIKK